MIQQLQRSQQHAAPKWYSTKTAAPTVASGAFAAKIPASLGVAPVVALDVFADEDADDKALKTTAPAAAAQAAAEAQAEAAAAQQKQH